MPRRVKPYARYSQELVDGVLAMARQGVKHDEIAAHFGLCRTAVSRLCIKHGIRRLPDMTKIPNLSIARAYEQGCTLEQLAETTRLSHTTISRIAKRYGVKVRRHGPRQKHPDETYFRLIAKGLSYKQIAAYLGVNPRTASYYITKLKRRMAELRA